MTPHAILAKLGVGVSLAPMFVRLTRRKRAKAGWFVALLYLFCVLAPGAALAVGDHGPCLPTQAESAAAVHQHDHSSQGASHQHGGMHAADQADTGDFKHKHDGKTSPGPCCAMLCFSALTVDLPGIAKPAQPISTCVSETYQRLYGTAPPLPYRPPNA